MKQAHRFSGPGKAYEGLTKLTKAGPQWTGQVRLVEDMLLKPLGWRDPARVFVNSMSDLFHQDVPDEFIDRVFAVMALCPQHTFQVLTKRPDRMLRYCRSDDSTNMEYEPDLDGEAVRDALIEGAAQAIYAKRNPGDDPSMWLAVHQPLPNVWLGVSVENQETADERIPLLLQTPAAVRFISAEPLLGPINLHAALCAHANAAHPEHRFSNWCSPKRLLHWVIVGGESGPGARACNVDDVHAIVDQCRAATVPVFVKQLGARPWVDNNPSENRVSMPYRTPEERAAAVRTLGEYFENIKVWKLRDRKGGDMSEWPEDLRVREFPRVEVSA
jgi:protein gp37